MKPLHLLRASPTAFAAAALLVGAAIQQARAADFQCNITDQRGNQLTYNFTPDGSPTGMRELNMVRNGQIVPTSGGATWMLSNDVLWSIQDRGWGIITSGVDGAATLQHNTYNAGIGECHHVGATIEASAPPSAPSYSPAPNYTTSDAVPITVHNHAIHIIVTIGSNEPANMLLDTGATNSSMSPQVADRLVASEQAVELGTSEVTLADNSTREVRLVGVYSLTIGQHVLHKVLFTVTADNEGEMLLGLDTLQRIGRFSIDPANGLLTFG